MKMLMFLPAVLLWSPLSAARLHVDHSVFKAVQTITYDCPTLVLARGGRDAEMITTQGGIIHLDISGGAPPYSIAWNGEIGGGGLCFVSMPGRRTVTVTDAAGDRVIRSVLVGVVRRVVRVECPPPDPGMAPVVLRDTIEVEELSERSTPVVQREAGRKADRLHSLRGDGSGTIVRRKRTEPVGTGGKPLRTASPGK